MPIGVFVDERFARFLMCPEVHKEAIRNLSKLVD